MPRVPLFPLGNALVPGGTLGLRLFEPRYLELLDDLLHSPKRDRIFGVVLIARGNEVGSRPNQLHAVGCLARLEQAAAVTDHATAVFAVSAVGVRRFSLGPMVATSHEYAVADIEWRDDAAADRALLAREAQALRAEHVAYRRRLGVVAISLDVPDAEVAWRVSEHTVLAPGLLQQLLEVDDPVRRTVMMRAHLRSEGRLASRFPSIPHIEGPGSVSAN